MLKKFVLTGLLVSVCCIVSAQVTIKGRVLNSATGEPVIGANIRVDHSLKGGTTNAKGEFVIRDLPEGKQTLQVSHVNYEPKRFSTSKSVNDVVIRMTETHNNLSQVVVTGTGTHRRMVDSPIPVNVLTAKDIREANVTNLEEALTKLTSNFSFSTSGMGTEMVLNGLNSDYILVLVNGRKLIGDDALMRINMANVKRIEILNGSASALYGSDAIGGVVNIITDDSKNKVDASSTTKVSDHGRFSEAVNLDLNVGKLSSYTSYQRQQSDGWQLHPMSETVSKTGEVKLSPTDKQAFTGYHSNTVNQSFSYSLNHKTTLYAQGSYYNFLNDRPVTEYKYNMYHENYTYGFGMKYIVNKKAYIDADFYSDNYKSAYDYIQESGDFKVGDKETRKKQYFYRGNVKSIIKLNSRNKLSAGLEYLDEKLESESDNISNKTLYTMALYAQDEWTIAESLQAVVGLRYIYNETFEDHFTPTASIMYKEGGFRGRLSFATGFRTPTLSEIYATDLAKTSNRYTIGNLELKPEESKNFSLNLEYTHSRFSVSATAFVNNVTNMINYRTLSDEEAAQYGDYDEVRQRDNIDKVRIKGVNVNANAYLGLGFNLGAGYTLLDARNLVTDNPIDKSVKYAGNVNAQWSKNWGLYGLNVNLLGRGQGKRYSETYDYDSSGFMLWDLNTGHTFNLKYVILNAGLGIENLFDWVDDRPWNTKKPYSTVTPGRAFYASLTIRFRK
ncbi:TonB-dependent receptor [uncultured Bacteroides sp.]|uniref:TonB-dependent receptor n=1 Tax=uncultured Bacteroides sp. TaxID=162156 RepID=UPI00267691B0|nr:TonB-dependent receptor [uncultured Bacteroides sp.]